ADSIIWKSPHGSRSTPLVFGDRGYLINYDSDKTKSGVKIEDVHETIQERVMCLDAKNGEKIWQYTFPVFQTDIVTSRLGWTNLAADPATGYIYAHGTQGFLFCFDGKDGKVVWRKSMNEEYGRVSGYGGRVTSPIVDEELVILGMCSSSWGDQDGSVFAIKARTGEPVWRYADFSISAINSTPVVAGNLVYVGHGEESAGTNTQGRVICLDASQVVKGEPKLVWKVDGIHARYSSPVIDGDFFYIADDSGFLYCLDAKSGEENWKFKFGRGEVRGSPALGDGKIYIGEVSSNFHILQPGKSSCKRLDKKFFPGVGGVDVELNGTPAIANGQVYFTTAEETFCIGRKDGISAVVPPMKTMPANVGAITHIQVVPAEVALFSGESATFKARGFDANGNFVKEVKAEWSLPAPTPPPGAKVAPPPLKATISAAGKLTVDAKVANQHGLVVAKVDGISGRARVRVAPSIPYANNFDKMPDGVAPSGWINTQGKYLVKTVNGNKVLAKVNDKFSPLISRGHAYITLPNSKDYTIECDISGTEVVAMNAKGQAIVQKPEMGVGANRYTLSIAGNVQKLRLMSWDALPRIDSTVPFEWKAGVWYRLKLTTEIVNGKGTIRGKAWPRDQAEPAKWTVEVTDSRPIVDGSATLYSYVTGNFNDKPGTEIYFDNLRITPNAAGKGGKGASSRPLWESGTELANWQATCPMESRLFPLRARLRP
ncbi:MAG: PQQ-binding-like beta-propeller repeat protein, partial [Planctomycetes bacterium]|nr:PQQ-binding-like beta-propeller repeat protein [Planctomycetota bacterium]